MNIHGEQIIITMSNTIRIHSCIEFKARNTSYQEVLTCCGKDVKFYCNLYRSSSL